MRLSLRNVRINTHNILPACLPEHGLDNGHAKVDREKPMRPQPYTKYMQPRKAGNGRGGLPGGKAHKSAVQCQVISPGNIHASNII